MIHHLLDFAKIEATGNDFIMVDERAGIKVINSPEQISRLCDRHFGVGADGLIRLSYSSGKQLTMRYFNADGSEGNMCGNGLRAFMLYAYILGLIQLNEMVQVKASDGVHRAIIKSLTEIKVEIFVYGSISQPTDELSLPKTLNLLGFLNTGVPHLVLEVKNDLDKIDVARIGRRLRFHPAFFPEGTNVNFVKRHSSTNLHVRTYERGVENETLSCGSGITASAVLCWHKYDPLSRDDYTVNTRGGQLNLSHESNHYFLEGPAKAVFVGRTILPV